MLVFQVFPTPRLTVWIKFQKDGRVASFLYRNTPSKVTSAPSSHLGQICRIVYCLKAKVHSHMLWIAASVVERNGCC